MKRCGLIFVSAIIFTLSSIDNVMADRRSYVWTYEYMTMPKNIFKSEYYLDTSIPDKNTPHTNAWKHQIELEYGITERWDIAFYQVFKQTDEPDDSKKDTFRFTLSTVFGLNNKSDDLNARLITGILF